jgi:hypothetical protein
MNIFYDHFVRPYKKCFQYCHYFISHMHARGTYLDIQRQPADRLMLFRPNDLTVIKRIHRLDTIKWVLMLLIGSIFTTTIFFQIGCLVGLFISGGIFDLCDFDKNEIVCQMMMIEAHFCNILSFLATTLIPWAIKGAFAIQSNEHSYRIYVLPFFYVALWGVKNHTVAIVFFGWLFLLSIKEMGDYILYYEQISIS